MALKPSSGFAAAALADEIVAAQLAQLPQLLQTHEKGRYGLVSVDNVEGLHVEGVSVGSVNWRQHLQSSLGIILHVVAKLVSCL